jgi:hypothetical protein
LPELLVMGNAALVLDATARAALLLFGGLWLTAGLLLTRTRSAGPSGAAAGRALRRHDPRAGGGRAAGVRGHARHGYGLYAVMAGERATTGGAPGAR